jgi:nucleotide-binding universal stress UspA family protein
MLTLRTVLCPHDGSAHADSARAIAEHIAAHHGAALHLLRVEIITPLLRHEEAPEASGAGTVADPVQATRRAPGAGEAIVRYAAEAGADLIVMGTHGRTGVNRLVMGSTAEYVLRRASSAVLTVPLGAQPGAPGPVLVAVDFSPASETALETAAEWAYATGAPLHLVHAVEPEAPGLWSLYVGNLPAEERVERSREALAALAVGGADEPLVVTREVRPGLPDDVVEEVAREVGASLVVQGSHGRRALARILLGSTAEAVARRAPCPVLTVKRHGTPLVAPDADALAAATPVPRAEWPAFFERLAAADAPWFVWADSVSPQPGAPALDGQQLHAIAYEPDADRVVVQTAAGAFVVERPYAVRAVLDPGARADDADDVRSIDIVRPDGARERLTFRHA